MKIKTKLLLSMMLVFTVMSGIAITAYADYTIHVNKDIWANDAYPDSVVDANDHGCDNKWAVFSIPYGKEIVGVWADNSLSQYHITQHNGLDGYVDESENDLYLCAAGWPANPATVKVEWATVVAD